MVQRASHNQMAILASANQALKERTAKQVNQSIFSLFKVPWFLFLKLNVRLTRTKLCYTLAIEHFFRVLRLVG